jgi:hypothetical protein
MINWLHDVGELLGGSMCPGEAALGDEVVLGGEGARGDRPS